MEGKSAYISIIGKPNVGKSSIMNALLGQKLAICSPKPQTTRKSILGIVTRENKQLIFFDTPGYHSVHNELDKNMQKSISSSVESSDAILFVTDGKSKDSQSEKKLLFMLKELKKSVIFVLNKVDLIKDKEQILLILDEYRKAYNFDSYIPVSAKSKLNINTLHTELEKFTKEGGLIFPEDELTTEPIRAIVAERIREKLLLKLDKEIPHGTAVLIDKYEENERKITVYATIICEKNSHKGIILGKNGARIKEIGIAARKDLEWFFSTHFDLRLWVKVKEDWRNRVSVISEISANNG